ncbi:MAG: class I SAM-dependent rRNA methyltransferase [candidate division WOR-3 bacterium]|nr:MAG: class I SAM-dependent rRNA methyltransferase [candidate division WOR-3 bacterium]
MHDIYIKKHHRGHPWIFSNEIKSEGKIEPGEIVRIHHGKKFLGRGFYNPHSLIAVRRFAKADQEFDQHFLDGMIDRALARRKAWSKENSFRLVHSESDGLPGLIIDKYENNYVIQINCYGMDKRRDMIIKSLTRMEPGFIYEKSDAQLRKLEGLEAVQKLHYGNLTNPVAIKQAGILITVDVETGQKTGFFFDLADIRKMVRVISRGRTVLDLFCYTGAFSLYAASGGALSVTAVDSSRSAIELAKVNSRNAGTESIRFICADVFEFLRNHEHQYDIIIADPPSFTKSKRSLTSARRGYGEINRQAMKHLAKDGILVTTSCSYHMNEQDFLEILRKAALDAGVSMEITDRATQSPDHPVLLNMPESHYLKCIFLRRTG